MKRRKMDERRRSTTVKLRFDRHTIYLRTGKYPDGTPGEVFIDISKDGTIFRALFNLLAKMTSIALQHGAPMSTVAKAMIGVRLETMPVEGSDTVTEAHSIIDLIGRQLWADYVAEPMPDEEHDDTEDTEPL